MRVLLTVERYAPAIGGAERVVQRIAEGLAARGHDTHVVTGGAAEETSLGGVSVHRFPLAGNEARGIRGDATPVLERIARIAPDVLFNYAAQSWPTDVSFSLLGSPGRPAMAIAPCGFSGLHDRRYGAYFERMPDTLRAYDAVVMHSDVYQDARFAADAGIEFVVIPNGADTPDGGGRLRATVGDRPLAVTVGSHVRSKGHADFARAVGRLEEVVGAIVAPTRRGLDAVRGCQVACRARARLRPERLMVVDGSVAGAVQDAIASADLFLFTSKIECAPLVILEAMAAGTPWVSYDVGNVSELQGGIVAGSSTDLVEAARSVLAGARPELGGEGRTAWEARHQWPAVIDRYEALFTRIAAASAR